MATGTRVLSRAVPPPIENGWGQFIMIWWRYAIQHFTPPKVHWPWVSGKASQFPPSMLAQTPWLGCKRVIWITLNTNGWGNWCTANLISLCQSLRIRYVIFCTNSSPWLTVTNVSCFGLGTYMHKSAFMVLGPSSSGSSILQKLLYLDLGGVSPQIVF